MKKLIKYWQIFWHMRRLHAMRMLEYRADFIFWLLISFMWTIFNFFFFAAIVNVTGVIAGWSTAEMYLLMAVFTILDSFIWSFFYNNMLQYTNDVFNGEFNKVLLKPIDSQFWLMTQNNNYANLLRFATGVGMLFWALRELELQPSILDFGLFLLLLSFSALFIYAVWFIISTLSFWVDKLDNINEIVPNVRRSFQVPHQVYTGIASTLFTVILPLGLVSSLPSEILLGRVSSWSTIFYFMTFTLITVLISRWFFNLSIKKYSGIAN